MCGKTGVGWEPISDIVDRLVEELARPGSTPGARRTGTEAEGAYPSDEGHFLAGWPAGQSPPERVSFHAARHSAEAELNGLAVGPTREEREPTATAQARGEGVPGRAHTTLAGATGVVIWDEWTSRSAQGEWASRLVLDDGFVESHQPEAPARLRAVRPKIRPPKFGG